MNRGAPLENLSTLNISALCGWFLEPRDTTGCTDFNADWNEQSKIRRLNNWPEFCWRSRSWQWADAGCFHFQYAKDPPVVLFGVFSIRSSGGFLLLRFLWWFSKGPLLQVNAPVKDNTYLTLDERVNSSFAN